MTKVSFIIVTFNSEKYIADCLHSIENLSSADKEIIVVDNVSTDNTVQLIEKTVNNVTRIKSKSNIGFAGGCNTGYKHTTGEFIALVNPDVILDKDWLAQLLSYTSTPQHEQTGIFASKIININCIPHIIDTAGDGFSSFLKSFKRGEGENTSLYDKSEYIFGACAGAALYRRDMIREIGFLDRDFFLLFEDADYNFRAQLAGWKVLYVPTAIVQHKVRSSIGHLSETATYYALRNSELVRIKDVPLAIFMRCLHWFLIEKVAEFIYYAVTHRYIKIYFKAKIDVLKMLPRMFKKRKEIMKTKAVSNEYIMSIFTSALDKVFFNSKIKKLFYG
jgi:GT2 family glycosyltransferase